MTERLHVREIDDDESQRLVRIIHRGSGSVVTWRREQMVLLSAQSMDAAAIASVAFTGEDRARDVIRNLNADGFSSPYLRYKGGHPLKFTLGQRWEIKKIAKFKMLRGRCSASAATDRPTGGLSGKTMPVERTDPLPDLVSEELTTHSGKEGARDGEHERRMAPVRIPRAG